MSSFLFIGIFGLTFILCLGLAAGIGYLITLPEKRASRGRLRRYLSGETPAASEEDIFDMPAEHDRRRDKRKHREDLLPGLSKFLAGRNFNEQMAIELQRARISLRVSEYIYLWASLLLLSFVLTMFTSRNIAVALLVTAIAYRFPFMYVKAQQRKWLNLFNNQIADTLVLISNCLKSGYSFLQSLDMVAREALPPMADECSKVLQEISLGNTVEKSLLNMVDRVNSEDIDLVITAVLIQREIGGSLAEILENIAETIRERIRIKGEIKTLTAQGRLSGYIVGALPVVLFIAISIMNGEYMSALTRSLIGWAMVAVALIMQIVGFLVIRKLVDIEV